MELMDAKEHDQIVLILEGRIAKLQDRIAFLEGQVAGSELVIKGYENLERTLDDLCGLSYKSPRLVEFVRTLMEEA